MPLDEFNKVKDIDVDEFQQLRNDIADKDSINAANNERIIKLNAELENKFDIINDVTTKYKSSEKTIAKLRDVMKKDSKFFKYFILSDPKSLSTKERSIIILIPFIYFFCCFAFLYHISHDYIAWVLMLGVYVFSAGLLIPLIFVEKYDEKYGFNSKIRWGSTYQLVSKNLSFLVPGLVMIILTVGFILNNLNKAFLISFAFIIPFLALFFRTDVFNDNSSIMGDETVLGYNPGYYGLLSLFLGVFGYSKVYHLLKPDLNLAILVFSITMLFQILLLIPDKINKIVFFEIRKKEGFILNICLLIFTYMIVCFILNGNNFFNDICIDLSLEGIIKKIITWGMGIILAFLFIKKIKKMEK